VRPDVCRLVNPGFTTNVGVLEAINGPAILDGSSGGLIRAIPGSTLTTALDVTPRLSAGLKAVIQQPSSSFWVNPSETGLRSCGFTNPTTNIRAAVLPRNWIRGTSQIQTVLGDFNGLKLSSEVIPDPDQPPPPVSPFTPSDRNNVRWIYSAQEQNVYMIGGDRQGIPTGEIWRYSLDGRIWSSTFGPVHRQESVRNVMAVAYDEPRGKLVVVDVTPASNETDPSAFRILVFDTHKQTSKVAAFVNLGMFTKVGLTARDDGSFALVGARWSQNAWTAYQFKLTASDLVTWQGTKSGSGRMIADPTFSDAGVTAYLHDGQTLTVADLPPTTFTGSGPPAELAVCDHGPTLTPPPAVTVSQCAMPTIGVAVASNSCGGQARVTRNGPNVFPLGQTVITWKAVDVMGHVTTATQTVTVKMGDDPSCCPAGTNVIVGTSNNDVLVGTPGRDCIIGLGGQDTISGGGGDDFISGGDGDDILNGGDGDDTILGGSGQDRLNGDAGNDNLSGGDGDDICHGGIGNDVIAGDQGQDQLFGDDGNDTLSGGTGDDTLNGGNGTDSCNGGPDHNTLVSCP
jgi:hypothetical protein